MAATKTPGVAIDAHGHRLIDKQYRGTRIYARLGRVTQADAERWLDSEIVRVNHELEDASNRRLRSSTVRRAAWKTLAVNAVSTSLLYTFAY